MKLQQFRLRIFFGIGLVATAMTLAVNPARSQSLSSLAVASLMGSVTPRVDALDALVLREPAVAPPERQPFGLWTAGSDKESGDLRLLLEQGEDWHLAQFGATIRSPLVDAKLTASGQVGFLPRGSASAATGDPQEPASLSIKGEWANFELGADYRSVGKRLDRILTVPQGKDQEGTEFWLARRLGPFRLRVSQSELTDNVDQNVALPQTTKSQTAVTAEASVPEGPTLGVTYATGRSERIRLTPDWRGRLPERRTFESLIGSAYYGGRWWDITASSSYSLSRDIVNATDQATSLYHDVSLSLRATDAVTVVPTLSMGQDRYAPSGTRGDSESLSLTLTYDPPRSRWHAWTSAANTADQTTDRSIDARSLSVAGGLSYDLGRILTRRSTLSLEAGYDQYLDGVFPASSSRGLYTLLLFKLSPF